MEVEKSDDPTNGPFLIHNYILPPLSSHHDEKRKAAEGVRDSISRARQCHAIAEKNFENLQRWCLLNKHHGCPQPGEPLSKLNAHIRLAEAKRCPVVSYDELLGFVGEFKHDYDLYCRTLRESPGALAEVARAAKHMPQVTFDVYFDACVSLNTVTRNALWRATRTISECFLPGLGACTMVIPVMSDETRDCLTKDRDAAMDALMDVHDLGLQVMRCRAQTSFALRMRALTPQVTHLQSVVVRLALAITPADASAVAPVVTKEWEDMNAALLKQTEYVVLNKRHTDAWPVELNLARTGHAAVVRARLNEWRDRQEAATRAFAVQHAQYVREAVDAGVLEMMNTTMDAVKRVAFVAKNLPCYALTKEADAAVEDMETIHTKILIDAAISPDTELAASPEYAHATCQLELWQAMMGRLQCVVDGAGVQLGFLDTRQLRDTVHEKVRVWAKERDMTAPSLVSAALDARMPDFKQWYASLDKVRSFWTSAVCAWPHANLLHALQRKATVDRGMRVVMDNDRVNADQVNHFSGWVRENTEELQRIAGHGAAVELLWHANVPELLKMLGQIRDRNWPLVKWSKIVMDAHTLLECGRLREQIEAVITQAHKLSRQRIV